MQKNEPQLSAEMEKRFRDSFQFWDLTSEENLKEVMHFLATALKEQKKELLAEVEGWLDDQYPLIDRAELRAKVQEMKGKTV